MEKLVIGIHGKSEHGKTTFEKIVAEIKPCQCFAFADSLKEYCAKITGLPLDYFYHRKEFTLPDIKVPLDTLVKHLWDFYQEIFAEVIPFVSQKPQAVFFVPHETQEMSFVPQETKKTTKEEKPNIRKKLSYEMFRKRLDLGLEREFRSFYVDEELFLGHITIGLLLQMIGTDVVRNYICDEFWVLLLSRKIQNSSASLILVTDVRDPKEKLLIENLGGGNVEIMWNNVRYPKEKLLIDSVDSETSNVNTLKGKTNDVEQTPLFVAVNKETLTNHDVEKTLNVEYKKQNDDTSEQEKSKNGETIRSIVLRVERQELANKSRRNNHISEIALDHNPMYTLENYGTREELETKIREIFDDYTPNRVVERIKNLPYRKSMHANV